MKKIKWGVLGPGTIANQFAHDIQYTKYAELVGVASRSKDRASSFASKYQIPKVYSNYQDLFSDSEIDAIYIATPHNFHYEQSAAALKAGKAVLCEKPITVNPDECKSLIEISSSTESYLMEGLWTYFLPAIQKAQSWVNEGRIGKILHVKADFGYPMDYNPQHRLYNPDLAGGAMYDLGIYTLAMAWLFSRSNPVNIWVSAKKAPTGVDDDVSHILQYEDMQATLHCSFRCKLHNYAYIIGDKGFIEIPDFWRAKDCVLYQGETVIDRYTDPRKGFGFNYETDAVCEDLIAGRRESQQMPLAWSLNLQEHIKLVLNKI